MEEDRRTAELARKAVEMLAFSYAPYSHHHVGAALETADGRIYTGCNIENAAFGPTVCAERTAFFKAVSEGVRSFRRIAIAGGLNGVAADFCAPCGVCRQVMMEFCDPDTFEVLLTREDGAVKVFLLKELLPLGFGPASLHPSK